MDTGILVAIIVIAALVIVAGLAWMNSRKLKGDQLRRDFGPEYDHAVEASGSRRDAERELEERRKRVEGLKLKELSPSEQRRFADAWRTTESHFVDDPEGTLDEADRVAKELMNAIGYPMGDNERQAADLSVNHAGVVQHYRTAHIVMDKGHGEATTEEIRQAMIHYRFVVAELLPTASVKRDDTKDGSQGERVTQQRKAS